MSASSSGASRCDRASNSATTCPVIASRSGMSGCYDIRARGTVEQPWPPQRWLPSRPLSCPGTRRWHPPGRAVAPIWSDGPMVQTTRHAGQWTLEDQIASPWHYLPVDVPPGTHAVRVTLDYDRSAGVLDLGCLGAAGFRGWSGGARDSFVIAAGEATPGYLPGEPEPGRWQVIIGLYRVPPDGLPYEVTAEIVSAPRPPARVPAGGSPGPAAAAAPEPAGQRRPAVARGRPAHPHRSFRRRAHRG